ncbi:capsular biosynthesis protein [Vibrio sp. V39_P1S14PM300]|uniref:capsular biosynthesis protein n=1 Tax=Vibrio sp. V39_P1S14PM300 TaxID=1938690 RepID=UPI0013734E8A|nr:capsular biosynthesis protein [Vibrio sp. V39_P1S14PM300]
MKRLTNCALLAGLVSQPVWADLTPKSHIGPLGIDFQSQVGLDYGHDSNVTYQAEKTPEGQAVSSVYYQLSPMIQATGERGEDRYYLMYNGNYRRYNSSEDDDFNDHFYMFEGKWRFGLRHGLNWNIAQTLGHEARGQETTEGFTYGQYQDFNIHQALKTSLVDSQLRYSYGAPEGRGSLQVAVETKDLSFRDTDDIQEDFRQYIREQEWRENSLIVELFDQYSSRTRFRYSFISNYRQYDVNELKDTSEYYLLYGIQTQRTGKTWIEGNIALLYKDFDNNPAAESFTGLNWDIKAQWKPLKHSMLELYTWQKVKDPSEEGGYILDSKVGASWEHHWWVDRLSTKLAYGYLTEDYRVTNNNRRDNVQTVRALVGYDFRPSIRFELSYVYNMKDSNKDTDTFFIGANQTTPVERTLGYDQSVVQLTMKVQI